MSNGWIDTRGKLPHQDNYEVWFVPEVPKGEFRAAIHGVFIYTSDTARGRTVDAVFANHQTGVRFAVNQITHWQPFVRPLPPEGRREPRAFQNAYSKPGVLTVTLGELASKRARGQ